MNENLNCIFKSFHQYRIPLNKIPRGFSYNVCVSYFEASTCVSFAVLRKIDFVNIFFFRRVFASLKIVFGLLSTKLVYTFFFLVELQIFLSISNILKYSLAY